MPGFKTKGTLDFHEADLLKKKKEELFQLFPKATSKSLIIIHR